MPKISVIVPVYRAEQYLSRCVQSILDQTFTDLEVILVDDGSPDNCGKICDQYAKLDSRVKVIHKLNGGASSAKNAALDIATGDYIGFVDSDDYIHPQMYELLLYFAMVDGSDMVSTERDPQMAKEVFIPATDGADRVVVTADEVLQRFHQEYYGKLWMSYQIKLFRKDIFQGHRFREGIIYEDTDLFPETVHRCKKITILPFMLYYYTLSDNSVMRSSFSPKRYIMIDVWKRYTQFFDKEGLSAQRDYYAMQYLYQLIHMDKLTRSEYPELKDAFASYKKSHRKMKPWLRKNCTLTRMQKLLLATYPAMPRVAGKIMERLTQ